MPRRHCLPAVLLSALLAAPSASAQAPSAADADFRAGRDAARAGDWATACAKFGESERLEPAPGTLLNIADCEEHLGKLVSAREHFDVVASAFPRGDSRHGIAADRAAALEKRIAHVTIRLAAGAPKDAVVREGSTVIDAAALGRAAATDPGNLTVVVSASGHADRSYPLSVREGANVDQTVDVGAPAPAPAPAPALAPAPAPELAPAPALAPANGTKRTLGLVLGGVGVASLGVGAVTGILAIGKASTVKDHCDASNACDPEGVDAGNAGQVLAPLSTVTLIAGAVLVGAGAYLFFTSRGGAKPAQAAFVPIASPRGGGAAWVQSF
jgi:hypothetical protein